MDLQSLVGSLEALKAVGEKISRDANWLIGRIKSEGITLSLGGNVDRFIPVEDARDTPRRAGAKNLKRRGVYVDYILKAMEPEVSISEEDIADKAISLGYSGSANRANAIGSVGPRMSQLDQAGLVEKIGNKFWKLTSKGAKVKQSDSGVSQHVTVGEKGSQSQGDGGGNCESYILKHVPRGVVFSVDQITDFVLKAGYKGSANSGAATSTINSRLSLMKKAEKTVNPGKGLWMIRKSAR